jgi:chromosome segregation ATPase
MEEKKVYWEKVEAKLKEWGVKIDELEAKAERVKAEVKVEYQKRIKDLRDKKENIAKKLEELKKASDEAWQGVKTGVDKAMSELKNAYENIKSKFKS